MELSPVSSRRNIRAILALCLLASLLAFAFVVMRGGRPARVSSRDIPLPFGSMRSTSLRGQLSPIGTTNENRSIVDMRFDKGEISEVFGADSLTFVVTPEDASTFSSGAPLGKAFTPGTRFYGYMYKSVDAQTEKDMRAYKLTEPTDENGVPIPLTYSNLFPGTFFASDADLADDKSFPSIFAIEQGVTFHPLSDLTLKENSRYLVIAETPNAPDSPTSDTTLTVRGLTWCGDGLVQSTEQCDDANQKTGDGCSACQVDADWTCTGSPSTCTTQSVGDLYVTKSATPVSSHQLLGGTLGDEVLRLQFRAETEDIDVTDIVLTASGMNAATVGSNIERLELYAVGVTTPFTVATIGGCGTSTVPAHSFCARMSNQEFVVQKGTVMDILVRPRMRTDSDGAVSGQNIQFSLDTGFSSAFSPVGARDLLSSKALVSNDADSLPEGEIFIGTDTPVVNRTIVGSRSVVVLSKINSITNADPNADGTEVPTGTARDIGQFKFTTAANNNGKNGPNKVVLTDLIVTVDASNILFGSGGFKIYNKTDPSVQSPCYPLDSSSNQPKFLLACWNIQTAGVQTTIYSGSDATFVLNANIQRVDSSKVSTVQVSFEKFSDVTVSGMASSLSHIRWLDEDAGATGTEFWWIENHQTVVQSVQYAISPVSLISWYNTALPLDVNNDGVVNQTDVQALTDYIAAHPGETMVDPAVTPTPRYPDVNNDGVISSADTTAVTDWIVTQCGNGTTDTALGEVCDNGAANGTACNADYAGTCTYCTTSCQNQTVTGHFCGDGTTEADNNEQCDKGTDNGKICNPDYAGTCNYCDASCMSHTLTGPYCGDGIQQKPQEQCDDGNRNDRDSCSNTCKLLAVPF